MRNLLTIVAILLIGCDNQVLIHPELLSIDYNVWTFYKNDLKTVKEFSRVPRTNRDSLIEPIGLSLRRELNFNKEGRLINSNCIDCSIRSHGEPINLDFVTKYYYEDGRLIKFEELSFDTTTYTIRYENFKSLTKGFKDKEQGYVSVEQYDSVGRPIKRIEFNFFYAYGRDQVNQVLLSKTTYLYDSETTYIGRFKPSDRTTLTSKQFELLHSDDFKKIESLANTYNLEYVDTEVISVSKSGQPIYREMHNSTYLDATNYQYSDNGLLEVKINKFNGTSYVSEYQYSE